MQQLQPKLMIAAQRFGLSGQPWMWRQVTGMTGFRKELICWERQNAQSQPTTDVIEHVLDGTPAPYDDDGRWLHRLRTGHHGNFYAAVGKDQSQIKSLLASQKPDVILCNFGDVAMRVLPAAEQAGIPLVAYFHGDFTFLRNRWYRWSLARCLHKFAAIVVVTSAERRWLNEQGIPDDRIHLITCGAPTKLFKPGPARSDSLVRFVMVSRLSDDKGCDKSINAFASVAAENPDARLDIYGDGPTRASLEAQVVELGLSEKITFHGYVNETALSAALPGHDIFIQHSRIKEGAPVAIVEAMACGLPVIATSVGGIPDQIEEGQSGYLIQEGDVAGMAQAMARLAADKDLRVEMGKQARELAVLRHDSTSQTGRLGEMLMNIVRKRAKTGQRQAAMS